MAAREMREEANLYYNEKGSSITTVIARKCLQMSILFASRQRLTINLKENLA